jgi:hypothetical protein
MQGSVGGAIGLQYQPPLVLRSLWALKLPDGLVKVKAVASSSQANQADVPTRMGAASSPAATNVAPSTRARVCAIPVSFAVGDVGDVGVAERLL